MVLLERVEMPKIGDLVYMAAVDIAIHDLDCKFRAYPLGTAWWSRAVFGRHSNLIQVQRVVDMGNMKLRQRNSYYGESCLMEVQVNEAFLIALEDSPDMVFFTSVENPAIREMRGTYWVQLVRD